MVLADYYKILMGGLFSSEAEQAEELRAHFALVRSQFKRKLSLTSNVNLMKIQLNYTRLGTRTQNMKKAKILLRKNMVLFKELRESFEKLKISANSESNLIRIENFSNQMMESLKNETLMEEIKEDIKQETQQRIHKRYELIKLQKILMARKKVLEHNQEMIDKFDKIIEKRHQAKERISNLAEKECKTKLFGHFRINSITSAATNDSISLNKSSSIKLDFVDEETIEFPDNLDSSTLSRINKAKQLHSLPDKIILLKSKLLIKEELIKSIEIARKRLNSFKKLNKDIVHNKAANIVIDTEKDPKLYLDQLKSQILILEFELLALSAERKHFMSLSSSTAGPEDTSVLITCSTIEHDLGPLVLLTDED
jgi:hypothetical protein